MGRQHARYRNRPLPASAGKRPAEIKLSKWQRAALLSPSIVVTMIPGRPVSHTLACGTGVAAHTIHSLMKRGMLRAASPPLLPGCQPTQYEPTELGKHHANRK